MYVTKLATASCKSITSMLVIQNTEETTQSCHIDLLGIKEGINLLVPSHLWPLIGQRWLHGESILPSYVLCYPALWVNQIQNPQCFISMAKHGGRSQNSYEYSWVRHGHQNYCGSTRMSMMEAMSKSSPPPHTTLGNQNGGSRGSPLDKCPSTWVCVWRGSGEGAGDSSKSGRYIK